MTFFFTGAAVADHPCMRICEWPPNPRNCEYNWSVESFFSSGTACSIGCPHSNLPNPTNVSCHQHPDCILLNGVPRPIIVVNKSLPGPSIQVGDGLENYNFITPLYFLSSSSCNYASYLCPYKAHTKKPQ